ncbi:MAG: hypothetical protein KF803_18615 [Cyclobacteriaceae bacterium]|nr:hypothetical protein [Cyclobacteriaceae bacterium]
MKNTGIWIDSREARIVQVVNGKQITLNQMFSGLNKKERFDGETSRKIKRGFTGFDYERQQRNRFGQALKQFCQAVAREVGTSDNVYLLGPAQTKLMLEKALKESNSKARVLGVDACDKLSDNQLTEKVKIYFSAYLQSPKQKTRKTSRVTA